MRTPRPRRLPCALLLKWNALHSSPPLSDFSKPEHIQTPFPLILGCWFLNQVMILTPSCALESSSVYKISYSGFHRTEDHHVQNRSAGLTAPRDQRPRRVDTIVPATPTVLVRSCQCHPHSHHCPCHCLGISKSKAHVRRTGFVSGSPYSWLQEHWPVFPLMYVLFFVTSMNLLVGLLRAVVPQLWCASESPGGFMWTQVSRPHSQMCDARIPQMCVSNKFPVTLMYPVRGILLQVGSLIPQPEQHLAVSVLLSSPSPTTTRLPLIIHM